MLFGFTVFIYLRVPETKGKTFEEIAAVFKKGRTNTEAQRTKDDTELQQLKTATDAWDNSCVVCLQYNVYIISNASGVARDGNVVLPVGPPLWSLDSLSLVFGFLFFPLC